MSQRLRKHLPTILLGLILLVAAALRLAAIDFALPNVYHPDEDLLVLPAMNIIKTGDLNPIRMDYGSFFLYLMSFVHLLVYLWSARSGYISSVDQLIIPERGWYPGIYPHPEYVLAGRLLSAAFGLLLVLIVYLLATRLGNRRMGLAAAAVAAVLPEFVVHSHYAMTDMAMTTMTALALYLLLRAYDNWESDSAWAYVGAGFVCGLAAATKFTGALVVVPLLLTPLLKIRRLDDALRWRVIGGPLAMAAGFVAAMPYALLDLPKFVSYTAYVLTVYNNPGYDALGSTWSWTLNYLFTGRNAALVFPATAGFVLSLFRWGRRGWIVNSFALVVLLTAMTTSVRESRTWMPLAPVACVWVALLLETALGWWRRRRPGRLDEQAAVYGLLLLLILLPLLNRSLVAIRNLRGPDVRTVVQQWIEANVPPGARIAFDRFPPYVDPAVWPVTLNFGHYNQSLDDYRAQGVRFVVGSDIIQNPDRLSAEDMARFEAMTAELCHVATFTGPILAASDLTFWVYEMPPCTLAPMPGS
jgi:hypothetical protein